MTNEEKAREVAKQVFPCSNEGEQRRIVELAYNRACKWKDQQLKEYLEKKRKQYTECNNVPAWITLDKIINELFGGKQK